MGKNNNKDNAVNAALIPDDTHLATLELDQELNQELNQQVDEPAKSGKSNRRRKFLKAQTSLLVALSLSSLFIFIAISLYNNITASRYNQVDMLVDSLLEYPTKMAANLIVARDSKDKATRIQSKKQLQQLVDEVSENQYVANLHIFAENGKLLSSSQDDYVAQLLEQKQYVAPAGVRVYLKPLLADDPLTKDKPVGFLQLHFSYQEMLKTFTIFQFDATKSILFLFLLLLLVGVIIGVTINRVHHKFRSKG